MSAGGHAVMRAAALAITLAAVIAPDARAQKPRITSALGNDAAAILVGRSAELYRSVGNASWKRDGAGGVSVDVLGLVDTGSNLYAVGRRTPLFVRENNLWYAAPLPNRGRVALSAGAPLITVDRHVYHHDGGRWKRLISARSTITAIWAASTREFYVATEEGSLARSNGRRWTGLKSPLPAEDPIVTLIGSGNEVLAVARSQTILRIAGNRVKTLTAPGDVPSLQVTAAGVVAGRPVLAAHATPAPPESKTARSVLLRAEGNAAAVWHEVELPAGDPIRVILDAGGNPLLVTSAGAVYYRQGDTWSTGTLAAEPPPAPRGVGTDRGPARSR